MKDLNHQLMKLCRQNRDGGFSTQATRSRILDLAANQLHALGFRHMRPTSLKPKHVDALVAHWQKQDINTGIRNNAVYVEFGITGTAMLSAAISSSPNWFVQRWVGCHRKN